MELPGGYLLRAIETYESEHGGWPQREVTLGRTRT